MNWREITIGQSVAFAISIATVVGPAWIFIKPLAAWGAETAINRILVAQGIDPQEFKDIPRKVEEQSEAQTRIESDLATLKAQQQQLLDLLKQQVAPQPEPQQ
jgi:hypothetical protein